MFYDQIVGVWKLVPNEFKYSYSDGEISYPFGLNATGQLIYTSNNYMSAQLMQPDRRIFASSIINKATSEEVTESFRGYIAYYGTYELKEEQGIIVHHIKGSYFPNWVGQDLERYFLFSDNRLTLNTLPIQTAGRQMIAQLIWERM
jgi:hypothetical protein